MGIDPDARLPGEEGQRIILFGAIALFGIPAVLGGGIAAGYPISESCSPSRSARSACCSRSSRGAGRSSPTGCPSRSEAAAGQRVEVVFAAIDGDPDGSATRRSP